MTNDRAQSKETDLSQDSISDGSELIPAEVQASMRHNDEALTADAPIPGTTVDDEGRIDNFPTEPKVYPATYPSRQQQLRYVFLGAGAILFIAILIWISVSIS